MPNQATRRGTSGPNGRRSRGQVRRRVELVTLAHATRCGRPRRKGRRGLDLLGALILAAFLFAPILMATGILAGTVTLDPPPDSSYWQRNAPQHGRDPQHTHHAAVNLTEPYPGLMWTTSGFQPFLAGAVVDAHNAYVVDRKGNVSALNLSTGDIVWSAALKADVSATPALAYGWVYVATESKTLVALSAKSGTELRKATLTGAAKAAPLVTDGRVYQGTDDGTLQVLDATTLEEVWKFSTGTTGFVDGKVNTTDATLKKPIRATPAAYDGKVYVASWNRKLYAFSTTGNIHGNPETWYWTKPLSDIANAAPAIDRANKNILVATADGRLEAFALADGQHKWAIEAGGSLHQGIAVGKDHVLVATSNGRVVAADPKLGTLKWQRIEETGVIAAPVLTKDAVAVLATNGTLGLWDPADGTSFTHADGSPVQWSLPSGAHATPTVGDHGILVVDQGGNVERFGRSTRPQVDLSVGSVGYPPDAVDYLPLKITATVTNQGPDAAPDVIGVLQVNGTERERAVLGPLAVGANLTWTPVVAALGLGSWMFTVSFEAPGADDADASDDTRSVAVRFDETPLSDGISEGSGTPPGAANTGPAGGGGSFGGGFAGAFSWWMVPVALLAIVGGVAAFRLLRARRIVAA